MPRAEAIQITITTFAFETEPLPELISFPFDNFDFQTKETERNIADKLKKGRGKKDGIIS